MNRIYKVTRQKGTGLAVVTSEFAKGNKKSLTGTVAAALATPLLFSSASSFADTISENFEIHNRVTVASQKNYNFTAQNLTLTFDGITSINSVGGAINITAPAMGDVSPLTFAGYVDSATLIFNNNQTSATNGGAISSSPMFGNSMIDLSQLGSVKFTNNIASNNGSGYGGGIYSSSTSFYSSSVILGDNVSFTKNIAGNKGIGQGGGIYFFSNHANSPSSLLTLGDNASFTENIAGNAGGNSYGGGIYFHSASTVSSSPVTLGDHASFNGNIASNKGNGYGGGIYFSSISSSIKLGNYASFTGNIAGNDGSGNGGGINASYYVSSGNSATNSLVKIGDYATFTGNVAGNNGMGKGGGIYSSSAQFTLTASSSVTLGSHALFKDNRAGGGINKNGYGGAIYLDGNTTKLNIAGHSYFTGNMASNSNYGGAIYVKPGSKGIITLNTATSGNAGAIVFDKNYVQVDASNIKNIDLNASKRNSIYLTARTQIDLQGNGNIYFNDPISSEENGNNSLVKAGNGMVQFLGSSRLDTNNFGSGNSVDIQAGAFRLGADADKSVTDSSSAIFDASGTSNSGIFNVANGAYLSGSGTIKAGSGGFNIAGNVTADGYRYIAPTYDIDSHTFANDHYREGDAFGVLNLVGDVKFQAGSSIALVASDSASLIAKKIDFVNNDTTLNLTGYHQTSEGLHTLINTTGSSITGNFTQVKVNGVALKEAVDINTYLIGTVTKNGNDIESNIRLVWNNSDTNNAHGTFNITGSNEFSIGSVLADNTIRANTFNWDGKTLTKNGTGTLILSGANTYTGGTTINDGGIVMGSDNALGQTSSLNLTGSSSLDMNGKSQTVKELLSNDASTEIKLGSLTVNQIRDTSYKGKLSGDKLIKIGSGTLTLGNTDNNYSGGTTILGGTLIANSDAVLGAGGVTTGDNGTLKINYLGFNKTLSGTGTLAIAMNDKDDAFDFTDSSKISGFTGTVDLQKGNINLNNTNSEAVLQHNTLKLSSDGQASFNVDQTISNLTFNGGTLKIDDASKKLIVAKLDASGGGAVKIDFEQTINRDIDGKNNNWYSYNSSDNAKQYKIVSTTDSVIGGQLAVKDLSGSSLEDNKQTVILDGGVGTATFNDVVTAVNNGLYLGYTLTELSVANNKNITLDSTAAGADASLTAKLSGDGGVIFSGSKTATITGGNDYAGGTIINAGTLIAKNKSALGSGDVNIANNATLGLDFTGEFNNAIKGVGNLTKTGAEKVILNGVNSYTGTTEVKEGILIVGGTSANKAAQITGDVTVEDKATLGGHGTILGDVLIKNGATLSPGNSIGTITIGNITFDKGSFYEFEVNPDGLADKIESTGAVIINGGTLSVLAGAGSWSASSDYKIIETTGSLTGQFDKITTNLAFLNSALSYGSDYVSLNLTRNQTRFADVAKTHNQWVTAYVIGGLSNTHAISTALTGLSADQARAGFDNLSGEIHASTKSAILSNRYARDSINGHLTNLDFDTEKELWVNIWAHNGHLKSDGNAAKLDNKGWGVIVGADAYKEGNTAAGLALSYEQINTKAKDNRRSDADVELVHFFAYGRTKLSEIDLKGAIGYSRLSVDSTRSINVGSLQSHNKADYDGGLIQAYLEGSHTFELSSTTNVTPFLNLAYQRINTDGFNENGKAATLHGSSSHDDIFTSTLGARGNWQITTQASLYGELGWQHTFGDVAPTSTLSFDRINKYKLDGVEIDRNSALIGIGGNYKLQPNMTISTGYQANLGDQNRDNALNVKFEYQF